MKTVCNSWQSSIPLTGPESWLYIRALALPSTLQVICESRQTNSVMDISRAFHTYSIQSYKWYWHNRGRCGSSWAWEISHQFHTNSTPIQLTNPRSSLSQCFGVSLCMGMREKWKRKRDACIRESESHIIMWHIDIYWFWWHAKSCFNIYKKSL